MKTKYGSKAAYENRAQAKEEIRKIITQDVTDCENCNELLVFAMKDNYHEFSIGLYTILQCLRAAEAQGYVPKLPQEWWRDVGGIY